LNAFHHFTGIASPTDVFNVYYAERCIWHIIFKINGTPGHGSLLLKDTAGEKLRRLLDRFFDYRATQVERLSSDPELTIGDVTTVNVTMVEGGVQSNVVPPDFTIMTDFRLAVDVDHEGFESMFKKWCEESGENIEYEWDLKDPFIAPTKLDDGNVYWNAFKHATAEL
jgi:aminoacylase